MILALSRNAEVRSDCVAFLEDRSENLRHIKRGLDYASRFYQYFLRELNEILDVKMNRDGTILFEK